MIRELKRRALEDSRWTEIVVRYTRCSLIVDQRKPNRDKREMGGRRDCRGQDIK